MKCPSCSSTNVFVKIYDDYAYGACRICKNIHKETDDERIKRNESDIPARSVKCGTINYKELAAIVWGFKKIYGFDVKLRVIVGHSEMMCLVRDAPDFFFHPMLVPGECQKFMGYDVTEIDKQNYLGVDTI